MKILIVSDIHANIDALESVLGSASGLYQGFLCLGDSTGYGPDPEECIRKLKSIQASTESSVILAGNHDAVFDGRLPLAWFNQGVQHDIGRTRRLISESSFAWLAGLLPVVSLGKGAIAVHGSPLDPMAGYLLGGPETSNSLFHMVSSGITLCFCGHTHEVAVFSVGKGSSVVYPVSGESVSVLAGPVIVNPGSVGFPRTFNKNRRSDIPPGGKRIRSSSYPAHFAIWNTDEGSVLFQESLYDRRPMEKRLKKQQRR